MARFKFGKKKRDNKADTTMTTGEFEGRPRSTADLGTKNYDVDVGSGGHSSALASGLASRNMSIKNKRAVAASTRKSPWKRHKLFNSPFPRYRHAAASISSEKSEIFLMGGLKEGAVFGDTWKIVPQESDDGEINTFIAKNIEIINLNNPPARVGHSGVLCGNAFIIFGGDTVDTDFNGFPDNNFYLFNTNNNKYTIPSHILNKPNGRYGHTIGALSLNSSSSRLYLFGGQLEQDVFNDLYFFELNTFKSPKARWDLVEPLHNFKPPPLANHSMSVYKNKIYVFGGVYNNEKVSNDLWCFDALSNKWSQIETTGAVPLPVNEHSSCIVNEKLYIYGGNDFSGIIYNSLHVLDLHTLVWSKLTEEGEINGPGSRCGHTMTYLPRYNKIIIMGGDKNDYVVSDPSDFEAYDDYTGEDVGTMIYELDLDVIDQFTGESKAFTKPTPGRSEGVLAASTTGTGVTNAGQGGTESIVAKSQGYDRRARSFSGGPEDFKTPNGSPDRIPKANTDKFVDVDVPSGTISGNESSEDVSFQKD
ncbi:uncharacterized protein PRCAT00003140001, partial [Priceomyces carsonii]|uniref:uncharacterized protein n=1 Tax=Priceomyces carsonii TaxID=28549 RepID=UPI002ED9F2C8